MSKLPTKLIPTTPNLKAKQRLKAIKLPIIIESQGNFFAQPPEDNQNERRVEILIIKKETQ